MIRRKSKPFEERLWSKIDQKSTNDCWLWTGGTVTKGYGTIKKLLGDKWQTVYAHREILRLVTGEPPTDTSQALHSCDTPACCNPAHLSWGTNSKNRKEARDRLHNQGNQKLIPQQVVDIQRDTRTYAAIAATYSVHPDTIARIKQGRAWLD